MAKELKRLMVQAYSDAFDRADSILFVDYTAVTAGEFHDLRHQARDRGLEVQVIRNALASKALEAKGIDGLYVALKGSPVAAMFGPEAGAIAAAKLIAEWRRAHRNRDVLHVRAGIMDGELSCDEAKTWKDLPTREEMLAILSGQIISVGGLLSSQLLAPGGAILSQIDQKAEADGDGQDKPDADAKADDKAAGEGEDKGES